MSATDELRRMLDERGVEWVCHGYENHTWWNGWHAENRPSVNGLFVKLETVCTPNQAIAATLGEPIDADLRKALDFMRIWISEDAHLGESAISYEFEKAEGLRKLEAIEQAIAVMLGRTKAKSHPYGYERDTGAYDCTRCECGCINDISATYCNDCGGEIEVDESAGKEYYDGYSKNTVFAKKHDDGSLELGERRSREEAERRAEEVEAWSSDEMGYYAMVVEFEVVSE